MEKTSQPLPLPTQPVQRIEWSQIILASCIVSIIVILILIVFFKLWINPIPSEPNSALIIAILTLLAPVAIIILIALSKLGKPQPKQSYIHTWNNDKYFPLDKKWLFQACKENPEDYGGSERFLCFEGDPEQTKGGRTPREIDALWALQDHVTMLFTKIVRVRHNMEVEPEESVIGLKVYHVGRDSIPMNALGRLKVLEQIPVTPQYTQVVFQPSAPTQPTGSEEEEESSNID